MGGGKNAAESLKEKLEAKGFEVTLYESPMDKIQKRIAAGEKVDFNIYFAGKDTIADFVGAQDLIITLVDVAGGFQAVARPGFGMTKGGGEIPGMCSSSLLSSSAASSRRSWRTFPRPAPISTPTIPLPLRWMCWWTS